MERRTFGDAQVPVIGQGTWKMENDGPGAVEALRAGLDLGLTHVDTAELYGSGRVEEMVAEAIEGRRKEVFLVSKVLPSNASRRGTVEACERSLRRLRTTWLDAYLLHWEGPHPLEDTIAAFEELKKAGKILRYGVSNLDEDRFREAVAIAGPKKIVCDQVLYNPEERHVEAKVHPACREHGAALVGYSPFVGLHIKPALREVAREVSATERQVVLAFLTRLEGTFAIPKASSVEHVRENAKRVELDARQIARLEQAYPLHVRRQLPTA